MKLKSAQPWKEETLKAGSSGYAARQMHLLEELYRLAGLAPMHAYQAAQADLQSLYGMEDESAWAP